MTINLGKLLYDYQVEEKYRKHMLARCDELRTNLEERCGGMDHLDMLGQYRKWFDDQNIESECEDGWPMDLVFEESNIQAFVEDWLGED